MRTPTLAKYKPCSASSWVYECAYMASGLGAGSKIGSRAVVGEPEIKKPKYQTTVRNTNTHSTYLYSPHLTQARARQYASASDISQCSLERARGDMSKERRARREALACLKVAVAAAAAVGSPVDSAPPSEKCKPDCYCWQQQRC